MRRRIPKESLFSVEIRPNRAFCAFLAVGGAALVLVAFGVVDAPLHAPRPVAGMIGALVALLGAGGLFRARPEALPSRPWVSDDGLASALRGLLAAAVFALFLGPFHWWAWTSGSAGLFVKAIVGFLEALAALGLARGMWRLFRRLRRGSSRLLLERVPYRLGDAVRTRVRTNGALRGYRRTRVVLRFVEDVVEGHGRNRVSARYELWSDDRAADVSPEGDVEIAFELPEDPALASAPPERRWHLVIDEPGAGYHARFVVPVHAAAREPVPA